MPKIYGQGLLWCIKIPFKFWSESLLCCIRHYWATWGVVILTHFEASCIFNWPKVWILKCCFVMELGVWIFYLSKKCTTGFITREHETSPLIENFITKQHFSIQTFLLTYKKKYNKSLTNMTKTSEYSGMGSSPRSIPRRRRPRLSYSGRRCPIFPVAYRPPWPPTGLL